MALLRTQTSMEATMGHFFFSTKNLLKTGACSHHRATTGMHNPMIRTATKKP